METKTIHVHIYSKSNQNLMNLLFKKVATVAVSVASVFLLATASMALAQSNDMMGPGPDTIDTATGGESNFRTLALTILDYFLSFLGFGAVIFVIYGGVLYVTAGGAQDKVATAKKILMYAGVGLIIILLSYALVNTILSAGSGVAPA